MLKVGNTKLGPLLVGFSIPAIETCPGRTAICENICYACAHTYRTPVVINSLQYNYRETQKSTFVAKMAAELRQLKPRIVRLHVAGDFYNVAYVRKWISLCRRFHTVRFYAYTRSWRHRRFYKDLRTLARLKNVSMWWSVDAETHAAGRRPPRLAGSRVAYLLTKAEERAGLPVPAYVDLVFRYRPYTTIKYYSGKLVCPAEQTKKSVSHIGCSECKLCFTDRPMPTRTKPNKLLEVV